MPRTGGKAELRQKINFDQRVAARVAGGGGADDGICARTDVLDLGGVFGTGEQGKRADGVENLFKAFGRIRLVRLWDVGFRGLPRKGGPIGIVDVRKEALG